MFVYHFKKTDNMNFKKISTLLLLCLALSGVHSQSTLYVKEKAGTQTVFALSDVRKLTFPAGSLTVNKNDGNSNTYVLSDIRYLNFTDLATSVEQFANRETDNMILFPNPVMDQMKVSFQSAGTGNLQIDIIDIQGKVLQQQNISSQNGTNLFTINIAQLPQGLYLCRLQNGNKLETIKFLKN